METKKPYTSPELKQWGTVVDLTQTGLTRPGDDFKQGSTASQGN